MGHVFLSYSRSDLGIARRLRGDLCAGGVDVWSDRNLGLGGHWLTEISVAISRSRAMVLLASPPALASKWVMREVDAAQTLGVPVIPLLAAGARYSDLPVNLAGINGVDLAEGYEESVGMIVTALGDGERGRIGPGTATSKARTLVLVTADEDLAATVRKISQPVGLVVDRPSSEPGVLLNMLASAHIAVVDDRAPCDTSFVAGYVAGRGGWVIWLSANLQRRVPTGPGMKFSSAESADLEREICAAAFLPTRPPR